LRTTEHAIHGPDIILVDHTTALKYCMGKHKHATKIFISTLYEAYSCEVMIGISGLSLWQLYRIAVPGVKSL